MKQGVLILCGGKSSRMGSDKAFLPFRGKCLLEHVLEATKTLQLPVLLVGNPARFASFGHPVIPDEIPDQGPLRGMLSGMKSVDWDQCLVLSCDTPFLTPELLRHILQKSEAYDLVVPQVHGRLHPLVGAYRTQIRSQVEALLAQGEYRMKALLDATNSCILDLSNHPEFGDDHLYINLNTPEEVKLWE